MSRSLKVTANAVAPTLPEGIDVAYYLIHSMNAGDAFRDLDLDMGYEFGAAARAGVGKIIYLGGLGDPADVRSGHLASRHEVGRALADTGVPSWSCAQQLSSAPDRPASR